MSPQTENRAEILNTVHDFVTRLLRSQLKHEFPVPQGLNDNPDEHDLLCWLDLLDLAITPVAIRDELSQRGTQVTARALIRYYIHYKLTHDMADRDKADFIATWIYKNPPSPGAWDKDSEAFPQYLHSTIGEPVPPLPQEHLQLVKEFDFIRAEVDDLRTFDELTDSEIVQKARGLKARFGTSFFHPRVLAAIAIHNVHFGARFDELFKAATQEIKEFADTVAKRGGNMFTRIDGNVTVKNLSEVHEEKILRTEYREAQQQFQKVSKFRKVVRNRTAERPAARGVAAAAMSGAAMAAPLIDEHPLNVAPLGDSLVPPIALPDSREVHMDRDYKPQTDTMLKGTIDTVHAFVKAAEPSRAHIVPLSHGNILLSKAEVEAFRADYLNESSFRCDYAYCLMATAAMAARVDAEIAGFRAKRSSAYLWKPHADALAELLKRSQQLSAYMQHIADIAKQRGLDEKLKTLSDSLLRLEESVKVAIHALRQIGIEG